jgi:MoaA/NifB/PqqE/SkfB family radical SAM enzyme
MKNEKIKLKPYILLVKVTERCNVGCYHCSISATPKGNDISFDLASKAIQEAKKSGINRIHLTGGEPLLYEYLADIVQITKDFEMFIDVTSSAFTKSGEDTLQLLNKLHQGGLDCVMLSYDEPHSKKVSIEHFTSFAKHSQNLGIHLCVFVSEGGNTTFKTSDLKSAFIENNIDINKIEWSISEYQFEGRGKKFIDFSEKKQSEEEHYCRCPYVMSVPTLTPNGDILLCNMARFKTKNFIIGNYPTENLETILHKMEHSPIYRFLSKHGPQQSLRNLGIAKEDVPNDMCRACEKYLTNLESIEFKNKLNELLLNEDLTEIEVDYEAILPIYQRYISEYGEKLI